MSRCQTCKHWKPDLDGKEWGVRSFSEAPEEVRKTITERRFVSRWDYPESRIADWWDWGTCALANMDNHDEVQVADPSDPDDTVTAWKPKSLAIAYDGSQYMAGLRTRFDFGCVQQDPLTDGVQP